MFNMCMHIKYITKLDIIFTIYFIHSKNYVYTYIYLYIFKYCDFLSALSASKATLLAKSLLSLVYINL